MGSWHRSCYVLLAAVALASSVFAAHQQQQPFQPVETGTPALGFAFAKRQQGCIANFYSCANQGPAFASVCCQNGQSCQLDASNNPACCPGGYVLMYELVRPASARPLGEVNAKAPVSMAVCTGTAPASFVTPNPAQTTPVSFVPNPYFSFPYIATSFAGPTDCSAAVSECSVNWAVCTAQLEGQAGSAPFGVTIVVPGGGGVTVGGGAGVTYPTPTATSICNSLVQVACSNLQYSMCTMTGTTASGFYFGTANAAAARPTGLGCAGLVAAAGLAGLGIAQVL
ncbi:hypothetical protein B0T26DRAFT_669766 [Lasiosphaeria miniovina]|uniref:Uncharacterized protein n=1 Tax=Lasiosphaeria miniovina TaxID=1954250 RepID=A0AA40BFL9_9PEZI|nr:uncharacterized protein B0T26DRAFT_669766 [Lasiosphaeria miniovina]KAK0733350.1 hypothetical protein B0T26DRAFT_669766 [Lasiosphaeria miniovina]